MRDENVKYEIRIGKYGYVNWDFFMQKYLIAEVYMLLLNKNVITKDVGLYYPLTNARFS